MPEPYHRGCLIWDRQFNAQLDELAAHNMNLSGKGLVHLVQRRIDRGVYEYFAIPIPKKHRRRG